MLQHLLMFVRLRLEFYAGWTQSATLLLSWIGGLYRDTLYPALSLDFSLVNGEIKFLMASYQNQYIGQVTRL
jgi:hypothetical protein